MRRILPTTAVILAAGLLLSAPAAGQTGISATADRGSASPGETVTISGSGWVPENRVSASLCGNQALRGSSDCDLPGSRTIAANVDGTFAMRLEVSEPPAPCPCVVFVTGEGTTDSVRFPIEIVGVASGATTSIVVQPAFAFGVLDARLEGRGPWTGYLGAATTRDLVLTVENVGSEPRSPDVSVTWGTSADPTHVVDVPEFAEVEPGAQAELTIPVRFDALTVGTVKVAGTLAGAGEQAGFVTSTVHYPWALIVCAIVMVQIGLLLIRNRIRRRLHPEAEDTVIDLGSDDAPETTFPPRAEPAPYVPAYVVVPHEGTGEDEAVVPKASEDDAAVDEFAAVEEPATATVDDLQDDDPEVVLSASTRLATQLRHETDLAVAEHRARARELIDRLQDDVDGEVRALRAAADGERDRLQDLASATTAEADDLVKSTADGSTEMLRMAREHHDEALAVLTDARHAAQELIDAAEARAAEVEQRVSALWTTTLEAQATLDQRAEAVRAQADQVGATLRDRLAEIQPSVDGQIEQMLQRANEQAASIASRADEDESLLRTQAHDRMVDIVRRTAEQLVVQVFTEVDQAMVDLGDSPSDITGHVIDLVEDDRAHDAVRDMTAVADAATGGDTAP